MSECCTSGKFYAVRQWSSGKVTGSRLMTEEEAAREVTAWRGHIGRAAMVADSPEARRAVRAENQADLLRMLDEAEPHAWISTTSHRSRERMRLVYRIAGDEFGPGPEYGTWPKGGMPKGAYYRVNARHLDALRKVAGLRVLASEPRDVFKKWNQ